MQDFAGIEQKLERAEESINNLHLEMQEFFQKGAYPVLPTNDKEALLKAIAYHKNLAIPPRFGVLAGEINHQFRSCFDHVVWHFSASSIHTIKNVRQIEFPIFEMQPGDRKSKEAFDRKIAGVTNPIAKSFIERLQPYNATDPLDDPLNIIHKLDIVDKHREVLLCVGTGATMFPREMSGIIESYRKENPTLEEAQVAHNFKSFGSTVPCISFRDFGRSGVKSVTEGLITLFHYTQRTLDEFRGI